MPLQIENNIEEDIWNKMQIGNSDLPHKVDGEEEEMRGVLTVMGVESCWGQGVCASKGCV